MPPKRITLGGPLEDEQTILADSVCVHSLAVHSFVH